MRTLKGFTFFELLLVLVLIGLFYALLVANFNINSNKSVSIGLHNLKEYLHDLKEDEGVDVKLVCLDKCEECVVFIDNSLQKIKLNIFKKEPKVYQIINDELEEIIFPEYINKKQVSKKVCFSYNAYANNSFDEMIVNYDESSYLFGSFLEKTQIFDNENLAFDFLKNERLKLKGAK